MDHVLPHGARDDDKDAVDKDEEGTGMDDVPPGVVLAHPSREEDMALALVDNSRMDMGRIRVVEEGMVHVGRAGRVDVQ